jgi:hypothetical protein
MADFISRDAEIQFFNAWVDDIDKQINDSVAYPHLRSDYKVCKTQILDCVHAIEEMPAADVVEVVRCRDCKHRPVVTDESHPYGFGLACPKEGAYQDMTCPYLCDDVYYYRMPKDEWYCAEGERRADNDG